MPIIDVDSIGRRQCIPIIYTRGTHYQVGFDVGRNFASIIQEFLNLCDVLHKEYLPAYESPKGRKAYDATIKLLETNYPQYLQELRGTAEGAQVPFHHLFLLHMNDIIIQAAGLSKEKDPHGCSSICLNQPGQEILGHNEDALSETLNHFYLVSAHIISDQPQGRWKVKEEKFTSLCYAGHLPGYTMSYNHHGLIFSINTLFSKNLQPGKTPRHILSRAMLAAENLNQVEEILRDPGVGGADGCSINLTFLNQEGDRLFHNIEMAPAKTNESELNIITASPGENLMHCNAYLRIPEDENEGFSMRSSIERMATFKNYSKPKTMEDIVEMLSDGANEKYPVFQKSGYVRTIATGFFDCIARKLILYTDNPSKSEPLVVLPIDVKPKD